jgi:hypothetical protein
MNEWIQLTIPLDFDTINANQLERKDNGSKN